MSNDFKINLSALDNVETKKQTKTYTYKKSYVTKDGTVKYCNQTVTANVSNRPRGRPAKTQVLPSDLKFDLSLLDNKS